MNGHESVYILDSVDAGSWQGGSVQVIKVRVSHGLTCRDPLGRIIGQHFLERYKTRKAETSMTVTTRIHLKSNQIAGFGLVLYKLEALQKYCPPIDIYKESAEIL